MWFKTPGNMARRLCTFVSLLLAISCDQHEKNGVKQRSPEEDPENRLFAGCHQKAKTKIDSLEVRYTPYDNSILIAAFMKGDNPAHTDHFYFTGVLANGARLSEPIGKKSPLVINCADNKCVHFSFVLHSETLGVDENVQALRSEIEGVTTNLDSNFSTKANYATAADGTSAGPYRSAEQQWHYSLEKQIATEASSVISTCHAGKRFMTVFIGVEEQTSINGVRISRSLYVVYLFVLVEFFPFAKVMAFDRLL